MVQRAGGPTVLGSHAGCGPLPCRATVTAMIAPDTGSTYVTSASQHPAPTAGRCCVPSRPASCATMPGGSSTGRKLTLDASASLAALNETCAHGLLEGRSMRTAGTSVTAARGVGLSARIGSRGSTITTAMAAAEQATAIQRARLDTGLWPNARPSAGSGAAAGGIGGGRGASATSAAASRTVRCRCQSSSCNVFRSWSRARTRCRLTAPSEIPPRR